MKRVSVNYGSIDDESNSSSSSRKIRRPVSKKKGSGEAGTVQEEGAARVPSRASSVQPASINTTITMSSSHSNQRHPTYVNIPPRTTSSNQHGAATASIRPEEEEDYEDRKLPARTTTTTGAAEAAVSPATISSPMGPSYCNYHSASTNADGGGGGIDMWSSPAFASEEEYDAYVDNVAPSRNLVCPITQELFRDPVVAEDGHTYERTAILRWFSLGRTRSPVTNSFMSGHSVYPNLAVQGMAASYREQLGKELLERSKWVYRNGGTCPDNGARIGALLDAGADTTMRERDDDDDVERSRSVALLPHNSTSVGGATALLLLIRSGNLHLSRTMLLHDAPVLMGHSEDDGGEEVVSSAEAVLKRFPPTSEGRLQWKEFVHDVRKKAERERLMKEEKEKARTRANQEHRNQQRTLAADARRRTDAARLGGGAPARGGIGELEDGWGYFPSLVALQFQGSIPPPSISVAEMERAEKERLGRILRWTGILVLTYLLLS